MTTNKGKPMTEQKQATAANPDLDHFILQLFVKLTDQIVAIGELDELMSKLMEANATMAGMAIDALANNNTTAKENQ